MTTTLQADAGMTTFLGIGKPTNYEVENQGLFCSGGHTSQ